MEQYNPIKIEKKWADKWDKEKRWQIDLRVAKKPYYNLMMFPYPSAEGLHIGNLYAFIGSDIHGRYMSMRGYDVFEPIGFDAFGIHSENFAIKKNTHPRDLVKKSTENFRRQLKRAGIMYSWDNELSTTDPAYYKWTQWLFLQLYKAGLAYQKEAPVSWCPSCKTVLANEQVIAGKCERCEAIVASKKLKQWFLKITEYSERLLDNLQKIDWSERTKIAQYNWIGKSFGYKIKFILNADIEDKNFIFLHAFKGSPDENFWPWLKTEIEKRGGKVLVPLLPSPSSPNIEEQVEFLLQNYQFNDNTVLVTHSLGGVLAMKLLPRLDGKINKLIMVAPPLKIEFLDGKKRPALEKCCDWKFEFRAIREKANKIVVLADGGDPIVPIEHPQKISENLSAEFIKTIARSGHFTSKKEPAVLDVIVPVVEVFTTRPDTLYGATYVVVSPEHELVDKLKDKIENWDEVSAYVVKTKQQGLANRTRDDKEKTGIELKGVKVLNPANHEELPVWIADYVLAEYGTGAIMAVPAHDARDFVFAKKYKLPILQVILPKGAKEQTLKEAHEGEGILINSGKFDGMSSREAREAIGEAVEGDSETHYHLRDWLISRQRYWGPPIPIIYCNECGTVPVPEKDLPVELPYIKDFKPTGTDKSPLATVEEFVNTTCPKCSGAARRETDVSDTFLDSSWYYLRYPSVGVDDKPWDKELTKKWLPVDMYIGGQEHAVLHLMYARFIAMFLYDRKLIQYEEPFKKFRAHGLLIREGAKISKSRDNIVNPDEYFEAWGADTLRTYLMFLSPLEDGGDWRDEGIRGLHRFLGRVWGLVQKSQMANSKSQIDNDNIQKIKHKTIKRVTEGIERLHYNTSIAALMEYLNALYEYGHSKEDIKTLLVLLAPFAPFITEELWGKMDERGSSSTKLRTSVHDQKWPKFDESKIVEERIEVPIQINGKLRAKIEVEADVNEEELKKMALENEKIKKLLDGKEPKKVIVVRGRLVNVVLDK